MKYLVKNKYWKIDRDYNKEKLLYLLIDRPDDIGNNYFVWKNNKYQLHRDYNLPAGYNGGNIQWNIHGDMSYREPHLIRADGKKMSHKNYNDFIKK